MFQVIIESMLEEQGAPPHLAKQIAAAIAAPGSIARACFNAGRGFEQRAYIERVSHPRRSEHLLPDGIRLTINHGPCHPSPYDA